MTGVLRAPAPPATTALPSVEVHASFDAVPRDAWDDFAVACGASAHLSHGHCSTWWSHYGDGRTLHLMVFRADDAIVGILPMFVERVRLGPVGIRRASLVGSDSTLALLDPPVRPRWARRVFGAALRRLLGDARCDAVRFAPLDGTYAHLDALRDAARDLGDAAVVVRDAATGPHVVFDLPGDFESYLASLDKRRRSDHRRGMKALREAHDVRTDVLSDPTELDAEFPAFRRLHDAQWAAEGKLGHFRDWPRAEAYHRDLLRVHGARGGAHLVRLLLDGETVSYQLCHSLGGVLHWVLPARSLRPELERVSLGRLGLVEMIDFAIRSGFRRIEAGLGHYDYKLQLGGTEHAARAFVVASGAAGARARVASFARLADAFDAVYYRAWFKRVAPRLPLPRRALWKRWIRSRP